MGRLYQRGKTWWGDWKDPRTGQRRRQSLHTRDKAVARERLRGHELADSDPQQTSEETLEDALGWLLNTVYVGRPAGTIQSYRHKARRLVTHLGAETRLADLTRERLLRYVEQRIRPEQDDTPAAVATVYKEMVVLRRALQEARGRKLWDGDLEALIPKVSGESQPRDRWLTVEEYQALAAELSVERRMWLVVAVQTGARVGEIQGTAEHPGLLWSHVDLSRGWIRLPGRKTRGSWRRVPVSEELRGWLESVPSERRTGALVERWGNYRRDLRAACARVRAAERRRLVQEEGLSADEAARRAPPIEPVSANDLRRTFASWLLQAGVSPLVVARLLGHGSTRMVERIYGQLGLDTYQAAIAELPCAVSVPDSIAKDATSEAGEKSGEGQNP